MRFSLLLFIIGLPLIMFGQSFDYSTDYKKIANESLNPASRFYFPELITRFNNCDSTLTDIEVLALQIGFTKTENYIPDYYSESVAKLFSLNDGKNDVLLVKECIKHLEKYPISLTALDILCSTLPDKKSNLYKRYNFKIQKLLNSINLSGDGSFNKPFFILDYVDIDAFNEIRFNIHTIIKEIFPNKFGDIVAESMEWRGITTEISEPISTRKRIYFAVEHIIDQKGPYYALITKDRIKKKLLESNSSFEKFAFDCGCEPQEEMQPLISLLDSISLNRISSLVPFLSEAVKVNNFENIAKEIADSNYLSFKEQLNYYSSYNNVEDWNLNTVRGCNYLCRLFYRKVTKEYIIFDYILIVEFMPSNDKLMIKKIIFDKIKSQQQIEDYDDIVYDSLCWRQERLNPTPPLYSTAESYISSLASIKFEYNDIIDTLKNHFIVKKYNYYTIVDRLLKQKGLWYNSIKKVYKDSVILAEINDKLIFFNSEGKQLSKEYYYISEFNEGIAIAKKSREDSTYYIMESGQLITSKGFQEGKSFRNGYAVTRINNKWGVIDAKGKVILDFKYEHIYNYSEGLFCACYNNRYGFLDKKGKIVLPFIYDYALPFEHNAAQVRFDDKKWIFIDKKGNLMKNFKYR